MNWSDARAHAKHAAAEKRAEARAKGYEGEACGECGNFTLVRNGTCMRAKGYEGEACEECGNFTLVRNGTCLKCDTCGSTTGCS